MDLLISWTISLSRANTLLLFLTKMEEYANICYNHWGGPSSSGGKDDRRIRRTRVTFRDQVGGELVEVVGVSDGADVEIEPGPMGVKEGSLVGKYESLVQISQIDVTKTSTSSEQGQDSFEEWWNV